MAAAPGTININGPLQTNYGTQPLGLSISVAAPLGAVTIPTLASGFNSIAVPVNATVAIIQFSPANAIAVTLKGVTGDTGLLLNKTGLNILQLDPAQATIGLTAASVFATQTTILFF